MEEMSKVDANEEAMLLIDSRWEVGSLPEVGCGKEEVDVVGVLSLIERQRSLASPESSMCFSFVSKTDCLAVFIALCFAFLARRYE